MKGRLTTNNEMKTTLYIILGAVMAVLVGFASRSAPTLTGATYSPGFSSVGTTNSKVTVNTTSTQVVAGGYSSFVALSTSNASTSCFLDNKTAASSSVAVGSGIVIPANSVMTFGPEGTVPYSGSINCIATATTSVGLIRN